MKFYTHVFRHHDYVYESGYDENGERFHHKFKYEPYLFEETVEETGWKSLKGKNLKQRYFESCSAASKWMKKYKDVANKTVYGISNYAYTYINDEYPEEIKYNPDLIRVVNIDIEVGADEGFPDVDRAEKPITAITIKFRNVVVIFGCDDFDTKNYQTLTDKEIGGLKIVYKKCNGEREMLDEFLRVWKEIDPDAITGWNIQLFDVPYMHNRIYNILGPESASRLSPQWNLIEIREQRIMNREYTIPAPRGIAVLDYLSLYRKFTYSKQESYKLDHIGLVEVGQQKVDYSEYGSLYDLYEQNFQLFIEYNIQDVLLVDKIDEKMKLLEQVYALAYDARVNYIDALTTVRMWDIMIHNELMKEHIAVPPLPDMRKERQNEGAYVKDPKVGMSKWVVSFDLNSLYPHLIMQYNISPETFVREVGRWPVHEIVNGKFNDPQIQEYIKDNNLTICGSGAVYTRDFRGFLPRMMERVYNDRVVWKKKMLEAKQAYEENPSRELEMEIARCNNMQMAKKIQLNSAYGALGNASFRWFDLRYAESITISGQLSIRWIEAQINRFLNKTLGTEGKDFVVAIDTDSMYLDLEDLVDKVFEGKDVTTEEIVDYLDKAGSEIIEPFIDKAYQKLADYVNAYEQKMIMKREAIADKGVWTGKKHYILNVYDNEGVRYAEPQLKMMGIEAVKSSTPAICRGAIKQALEIIMRKENSDLVKYVQKFEEDFRSRPFEDVAFPRGLSSLRDYADSRSIYRKGTPIHVRGALVYNHMLDQADKKVQAAYERIHEGEQVRFCYLKLPNPARENVITCPDKLPPSFNLDKYIDYDTQLEKTFIKPVKAIADLIGWRMDNQRTLEDFWQ